MIYYRGIVAFSHREVVYNKSMLIPYHYSFRVSVNSTVDEKRFGRVPSRVTSSPSRVKTNLAQKAIHYSNGSLHSDSMSSHSISPAPSPSPRQPNASAVANSHHALLASSGGMGKRWSSTGDFISTPGSPSGTGSSGRYGNNDVRLRLGGLPLIRIYLP